MRRGALRKSKSHWASSEAARGHEPVAQLGRLARAPQVRGRPLVGGWGGNGSGQRDPVLGS